MRPTQSSERKITMGSPFQKQCVADLSHVFMSCQYYLCGRAAGYAADLIGLGGGGILAKCFKIDLEDRATRFRDRVATGLAECVF